MSGVEHAVRLARIDVRRMLRKHTDWSRGLSSLLSLLIYVVMLGGATVGGGWLGYQAGGSVATGSGSVGFEGLAAIEIVRGILALFWLMVTFIYVLRTVGQRGVLAQAEGILTVVPTRQAVFGLLLAEYVYLLLWVLGPAVGLGAGLSLGAGVVWPVLAVPLAVAGAGVSSVAFGVVLGVGIRHVVSRFEFVARHKGGLIVFVFVAYFVALSSGAWNEFVVGLFEPMQRAPVGWYADLALVGTPRLAASPVFAASALGLAALLGWLGLVAGTAVANRHWFSDPALAGSESAPAEEAAEPGIERRLQGLLGRRTAALVTLSWRRAKRSPLKLLYAFYPLLIMAGLLANIVQTGEVPTYLPVAVLVFAAWAAGVVFTLNPLGDQGAVLPSTLLSGVDGRTFVRAHVAASLVIAVPVGTVVTGAVALVSPVQRGTALLLVAATPAILLVSAALSVGIGTAFPRFEATNVTKSMKTVLPSRWAFVLFSVHLLATTVAAAIVLQAGVRRLVAAFVSLLLSWILPVDVLVTPETLRLGSVVVLVPLVLAPLVAYRYAVSRFDSYTLA